VPRGDGWSKENPAGPPSKPVLVRKGSRSAVIGQGVDLIMDEVSFRNEIPDDRSYTIRETLIPQGRFPIEDFLLLSSLGNFESSWNDRKFSFAADLWDL
jgi:hypothetical protein